jgi:primosomal protein N' (replication factor Y)
MNYFYNIIPAIKLPYSLKQNYTYESLVELQIGDLVNINFANRKTIGVVDSIAQEKDFDAKKIKTIENKISEISLSPHQIKLARNIADYYHASLGLVLKSIIPPILKNPRKTKIKKIERQNSKIVLTKEQKKIIDDIKNSKTGSTHLLHGVTGSGKTEVYMNLIDSAINKNQQCIVLVPEISLTPQAIQRYSERYGSDKIAVIHSNISKSEKISAWKKIKNNEIFVIIGPRSAIFSPVNNLGYIIIDEEHDSSYKQYDQQPRYYTKTVANFLAEATNCKIVLGSATPSLVSYYDTKKNKSFLHSLPNRVLDRILPKVVVVDMKDEFTKKNFSIFSDKLQEKIIQTLENKKQIILFLNRRGSSTFVSCRACGYVEKCDKCDLPFTYHSYSEMLHCHHCEDKKKSPTKCPACDSLAIKFFGAGTQRVETELKKLIPDVKVVRMDRDTIKEKEDYDKFYHGFKDKKFDVLIGTQMITKGWDFSSVGLVGIISADITLNLPDFSASENTFQLLTQVAGRTGRGDEIGEVVLQTYSPEHFVIKSAEKHNYQDFYDQEIEHRKLFFYPPFSRLVKLIYKNRDINIAQKKVDDLSRKIKEVSLGNGEIEIIGPSPAFSPKINNNYIFQIIIKIKNEKISIKNILNLVPDDWIIDIDTLSLI